VIGIFAFADDAAAAPAASLTVGGWGRMGFELVDTYNATQATNVSTTPGWANGNRIGVAFHGTSANIGFDWNFDYDGATLSGTDDVAKIWAKISPMFEVELGRIEGDTLRGKIGGDSVSVTSDATGDNDTIFARFFPKQGILLDITPMPALYIGASIDAPVGGAAMNAMNSYQAVQVGAGYTIENVGLVRAQYIGSDTTKGAVQAAFAYTGMAGLTVDVGATIPMDSNAQMVAAGGVNYGKDALAAVIEIKATFGGASGSKTDLDVWGDASYKVADPLAAGAEFTFEGLAASQKLLELFPYAQFNYGAGSLRVGFLAGIGLDSQPMVYKIPVVITFSF
jgi:hypothetical protein